MRIVTMTAVFVAGPLLLGGCGSTIRAVELMPARTAAVWKNDNDHSKAFYCSGQLWQLLTPSGLFEGAPPTVGYWRSHKPGSGPFPCWEWSSNVARGLVQFDLIPLSGLGGALLSATLDYDATYEWKHPTIATGEIEDIVASIYIVDAPWGPFAIAAEKIIDTAKWSGIKPGQTVHFSRPVDVAVVRGWVNGTRPNHGMLFVGRDEALPGKANGAHLATLSNLRLTVQVAEPKAP